MCAAEGCGHLWSRFEVIETENIQIAVDQLRVSLDEIGRYAGGSRYRLDEKMKALAEDMLQKATQLARRMVTEWNATRVDHAGPAQPLPTS